MDGSNQITVEWKSSRTTPNPMTAWLKLAASIAVLALLVFGVAPLGLKLPGLNQISRFARSHDIKVTAIYYTDIEEFAQAEADLRSRLEYSPSK